MGDSSKADTKTILNTLRQKFIPNKIPIFKPAEREDHILPAVAGYKSDYTSINNKATAYICHNFIFAMPTSDISRMLEMTNILQGKPDKQ